MDSPDSPKSQRRPELASPAAAAPAWRKYFTRQRLRLFLILSVAAHLILGLSWGVPAYLKDKRLAAALVQQQKAREEAKRGAEQAVAVAKKKNLQTSVDEVKEQAKKSFDAITSDLERPDKEKVWSTVEPKLQPTEQLLATAMGDRSMTDQDLRNLQAALNRELIEAVNQTLSANSAQDEINSFLNDVGARVAPELINHYRDGLTGKVAQPVRGAADAFVGATRDETARAVTALDPIRRTASDAVNTLRDAIDSAGGAADRAAQAGDPKYAAEQAHEADLQLTRAAAAQDAADGAIAKLVEGAKPLAGNGELLARLKSTVKSLETTRAAIKPARDAHAAANYANCARELTAASLTARKLGAETNAAMDVYGQGPYTAELAARGSIAALKDKAIPEQVNEKLTKGFAAQAADRIVEALGSGLIKRLGSSGIKAEPAQIAAARSRAKEILVAKVSEVTDFGASTTRYLNDPAGSSVAADGVDRLTDQLKTTTTPIIDRGVNETLADAALDAHLGNLVERPAQDPGRNDVQDRVAMLAARAADGRSGELDRVSFNDLRENALARAAAMDRISDPAKVAVATEPTTAPVADAPPVVEDIRKDIQRALQRELDKLLEGKLAAEKAAKVSEQVAKATDAAISRLAQDVIDPNVSDSDLENRRLDFSGKFLDAVHGALDKTASADVAKELLQKLSGQTGDAIAENYRNAVKDNVGNPLAREWRAETDRERHAAEQRVRDIRVALDSTKSVAEKAAQVLDQVKDQAARASADAKDKPDAPQKAIADGQAKLKEVSAAVASARADLEKAQKDVPADAAELKVRLKEIAAGVSQVDAKVKDAASKPASAAEFDKSVADARAEVEKFRGTLNGGDAAVNQHTEQAEATFLKAAQSVKDGDGKSAPGVKSKVQEEFAGQFRKEALPRLTKEAIRGFVQKLDQAGVVPDADDKAALERAIAEALDKKVSGEGHVADGATADMEKYNFFDRAKVAKAAPTTQAVEKADHIAEQVTHDGVASAISNNGADGQIERATGDVQQPGKEIVDLKAKVSRIQGQLRGGRGGVLAEDDAANTDDTPGNAAALRKKWQTRLAGLGQGDGAASSGGAQKGSGAATAGAAGPGSGTGTGTGAGSGGIARGGSGAPGQYMGRSQTYDEEKYRKLMADFKDKEHAKGSAMTRTGAEGQATVADADGDAVHPAGIISATTQPVAIVKNDQPYKPTFKSLQFAVIPYVNKPIVIGDNFDAWADVPALHLRPELGWLADKASVKILDDVPVKVAWDSHGIYFMYETQYAAGHNFKTITENFWFSDCLEVFIDTMNTKELRRGNGAGQQFWYWPFGSEKDDKSPGGESIFMRQTGFNFSELKPAELQRFARATPNGYQMQCRVPIERVRDADLLPGKILGFNVTIETGTKLHYYWSASKVVGTSVRPDTWGDVLLGGSDGRVEFPEKLAFEAGGAASSKLVNAFVVGEPLRIRVTDHDMNLNEKVQDKVSVTVRNGRSQQEVAILEETGADSGIFEGSVRTTLDIGEPVPGAISCYEGEKLSVTYVDQARGNGARNSEIVCKIKAGPSVMVGGSK